MMKKLLIFIYFALIAISLPIYSMENDQLDQYGRESLFSLPIELKQYVVQFVADDEKSVNKMIKKILDLRLLSKEWKNSIHDQILWKKIFTNFLQKIFFTIGNSVKIIDQMDAVDFSKNEEILFTAQTIQNLDKLIKKIEELKDINIKKKNIDIKTIIISALSISLELNNFKWRYKLLKSCYSTAKELKINLRRLEEFKLKLSNF